MLNPYLLSDALLSSWLLEDAPTGDLTGLLLGFSERRGVLHFTARDPMRVCGCEEALRMGQLRGLTPSGAMAASGQWLQPGEPILSLGGTASELMAVWKMAQTLMEYLSGIASYTAELVALAQQARPGVVVSCTRKHFPGSKAAAIKAILCGGAVPHRLGLSDSLLLFAEHRQFMPQLGPVELVQHYRQHTPERKLVVEVATADEALAWARAGVDVLQLEKFTPPQIAALRAELGSLARVPLIAAAGGIQLQNVCAYAASGADVLVTTAPYLAPPRDVQVRVTPE